jgi:PAT family beta-lactamase induction signal transducer AmpG
VTTLTPAVHDPGAKLPHPVVWTILYIPFGALGGFIGVSLTFLATRHGLSITEGSLLNAVSLVINWLKWLWAPIVDTTFSPKTWYRFATVVSALGVLAMSAMPLSPSTLGIFLAVVAVASFVNSMVGMSIEAIMAAVTPPDQQGRVSGWFQAGNLGGNGLGGGLGLYLLGALPEPWMAGAILGVIFLTCAFALPLLPDVKAHVREGGAGAAVKGVVVDLWEMLKTKGGLLAALLFILPISTGAAQGVLTQSDVAAHWGAGESEVGLIQGFAAGIVTVAGCFVGGWLCDRLRARTAYGFIGVALALVAIGMAVSPFTVPMYVVWSLIYSFGVGLAYAAFTAVVLDAIGAGSAATKYSIFASLSNFPLSWLGVLLASVAQKRGADVMLLTEAAFGVVAVAIFAGASAAIRRSRLAD